MKAPGVEIRPIHQIDGGSHFNEIFLTDVRTPKSWLLGELNNGWNQATAMLMFERVAIGTGSSSGVTHNLADRLIDVAKNNGKLSDPVIRQRIAHAHTELKIMRYNAMRMLSGQSGSDGGLQKEALIYKLYWASWHRSLGELAMDVMGPECEILPEGPYALSPLQSMYLFVRSDTIYGGTNQIQRNIIAERGLGMPKEPRGTL